eukprot:TRINITY_DN4533_c0_g1_i2.p3 TRINITY_DN4533_c0_g1~~TRINITY_DN4533_c0_g1_i2.p3  ORF type:complete len:214 (+),score=-27.61 TRINITY_DN4533_c0_g1_i2:245-886(+)
MLQQYIYIFGKYPNNSPLFQRPTNYFQTTLHYNINSIIIQVSKKQANSIQQANLIHLTYTSNRCNLLANNLRGINETKFINRPFRKSVSNFEMFQQVRKIINKTRHILIHANKLYQQALTCHIDFTYMQTLQDFVKYNTNNKNIRTIMHVYIHTVLYPVLIIYIYIYIVQSVHLTYTSNRFNVLANNLRGINETKFINRPFRKSVSNFEMFQF